MRGALSRRTTAFLFFAWAVAMVVEFWRRDSEVIVLATFGIGNLLIVLRSILSPISGPRRDYLVKAWAKQDQGGPWRTALSMIGMLYVLVAGFIAALAMAIRSDYRAGWQLGIMLVLPAALDHVLNFLSVRKHTIKR